MTIEEKTEGLIEQFGKYQRIKRDNGGHINPTLDYEINILAARLSALGVDTEELILN